MTATVTGAGTISFRYKVSSEANGDYLGFQVDGSQKLTKSGTDVTTVTTYTFNVTGTGSHQLKWRYYKNGSQTAGSDAAWISQIKWTPKAN